LDIAGLKQAIATH